MCPRPRPCETRRGTKFYRFHPRGEERSPSPSPNRGILRGESGIRSPLPSLIWSWSRTTAPAVAFAILGILLACVNVCVTDALLHSRGPRPRTFATRLQLRAFPGCVGAARAAGGAAAAWQRVGTRRGRRLPSSLPPAATAKPTRWFSGLFLFPCCSCLLQSCSSPPTLGDPCFVLSCVSHSVYFYCKFQRFMRP
jgi:hypothetical protein